MDTVAYRCELADVSTACSISWTSCRIAYTEWNGIKKDRQKQKNWSNKSALNTIFGSLWNMVRTLIRLAISMGFPQDNQRTVP